MSAMDGYYEESFRGIDVDFLARLRAKRGCTDADMDRARAILNGCTREYSCQQWQAVGRLIAQVRAEAFEQCAALHEDVPIEADSDMAAVIRYRDLIRRTAGGAAHD